MTINNGDKPANPLRGADGCVFQFNDGYLEQCSDDIALGLTKREHFAAMAMQGLCVNTGRNGYNNEEELAKMSVLIADGLLKELER